MKKVIIMIVLLSLLVLFGGCGVKENKEVKAKEETKQSGTVQHTPADVARKKAGVAFVIPPVFELILGEDDYYHTSKGLKLTEQEVENLRQLMDDVSIDALSPRDYEEHYQSKKDEEYCGIFQYSDDVITDNFVCTTPRDGLERDDIWELADKELANCKVQDEISVEGLYVKRSLRYDDENNRWHVEKGANRVDRKTYHDERKHIWKVRYWLRDVPGKAVYIYISDKGVTQMIYYAHMDYGKDSSSIPDTAALPAYQKEHSKVGLVEANPAVYFQRELLCGADGLYHTYDDHMQYTEKELENINQVWDDSYADFGATESDKEMIYVSNLQYENDVIMDSDRFASIEEGGGFGRSEIWFLAAKELDKLGMEVMRSNNINKKRTYKLSDDVWQLDEGSNRVNRQIAYDNEKHMWKVKFYSPESYREAVYVYISDKGVTQLVYNAY